MGYLVGIDGGGTKTKAVLADRDCNGFKEIQRGGTNYQVKGPNRVAETIISAIDDLLGSRGIDLSQVEMITAGLAGVERKKDKNNLLEALTEKKEKLEPSRLCLVNDMETALYGAFEGKPGVIMNVGTGAIALGKNADGKFRRADGWGYLLGDEGSGFWIGLEAIKRSLKDRDGRGNSTNLREEIRDYFELPKIDLVVNSVYGIEKSNISNEIAALSPLVMKQAREGDSVARDILKEAREKVTKTSLAVIRSLGFEERSFQFALVGGVVENKGSREFRKKIKDRIEEETAAVQFTEKLHPPEIGAIFIARKKMKANN